MATKSQKYVKAICDDFHFTHSSFSDLQLQTGQRVGWGIHYNPHSRHSPDFLEQQQQLVLCFVSIDLTIVFAKLMLQPPGGWYPTIMLHSDGTFVIANQVSVLPVYFISFQSRDRY